MKPQIIPPPNILKNHVRYFWTLDLDDIGVERTLKTFSDPYPRFNFQCVDGHSHIKTEDGQDTPNAFVIGVKSQPQTFTIQGAYSHTGISFYPHALKCFFHADASEFANQIYPLEFLFPHTLIDQLYEAQSHRERIKLLSFFLIKKLLRYREDKLVQDFIAKHRSFNDYKVANLMKRYNLSERQLERKIKALIGIPPKTFLRIVRFERAYRMLTQSSYEKLSDIAFDLGYADQSHFIRDFKTSAGFTPKVYHATTKIVEESSSFLQVKSKMNRDY